MAKKKKPTKTTRARKVNTASRASSTPKRSPKKKVAKKSTPSKSSRVKKKTDDGETDGMKEIAMDRRHKSDRRAEEIVGEIPGGKKPPLERRKKVNRRRQIDPTTCERDYSDSEIEFMNALDDYKRKNGRMFPTCSEVLEVIHGLGYVQLSPVELAARRPIPVSVEITDIPSDLVPIASESETKDHFDPAFEEFGI